MAVVPQKIFATASDDALAYIGELHDEIERLRADIQAQHQAIVALRVGVDGIASMEDVDPNGPVWTWYFNLLAASARAASIVPDGLSYNATNGDREDRSPISGKEE